MGFPCGSILKESAYNAGDPGSVPGLWRSHGERNGNPFQYSSLGNPVDWRVAGYTPKVRHDWVTNTILFLLLLHSSELSKPILQNEYFFTSLFSISIFITSFSYLVLWVSTSKMVFNDTSYNILPNILQPDLLFHPLMQFLSWNPL